MAEEELSDEHFIFSHKVFSVEGGYFSTINRTEPVFNAKLGELTAIINFARLKSEFGIAADTEDGAMLKNVREALKIVKIVKPGDRIPSELLDGTASWSFDPRMRAMTKTKVVNAILEWYRSTDDYSNQSGKADQDPGEVSFEDPVDVAFENLGKVAKIGGASPRKEIAEMVERLSDELTYIEAIGERLAQVSSIRNHIRALLKSSAKDAEFGQELMRIEDLIGEPIKKVGGKIKDARAKTFNVVQSFSEFSKHTAILRGMRDQMRWELMDWDEIFEDWADATSEDGRITVELCRRIYRLLAEKYARGQSWNAMA